MKISKRQLKRIIREEKRKIIFENEGLSNSDFAKELKTGAGDLASTIPTALNDEFATAVKKMSAMAKFDKSKFEKVLNFIDSNADTAMQKMESGDDKPVQEGLTMKINKRQLRKIVQEEKTKLQEMKMRNEAGIFDQDYIYDLLVDEVDLYLREDGPAGLTRTEQDMLRGALMGAFQSIVEDFGI